MHNFFVISRNFEISFLKRNKLDKVKETFQKKIDLIINWNMNASIEIKKLYRIRNAEIDQKLKEAFTLKESFINGARDSIDTSKLQSDKSLQLMTKSTNLIDEKFNITVSDLREKMITAKYDMSDKLEELKNQINDSKINLNEVENLLIDLHRVVCADPLTQLENIENNLEDKCSKDSLFSAYKMVLYINKTFESVYLKKEIEIKENLTKVC